MCGWPSATQAWIRAPSRTHLSSFTTKPPGKGTGLGRATVYGIVQQSGGSIWVYSQQGYGTTIKIYLPQIAQEPIVVEPVQQHVRASARPATILLAEDDPAVRGLVQKILQQYGYTVVAAQHGVEALAHARDMEPPD